MANRSLKAELGLDMPFEDVLHETVLSIIRTATLLSQSGAGLFRQFDLTPAQFNVLLALKYKNRDLTQSALSKRLVVTRASITSVLDKLEGKGLVCRERVPKNRRIYYVALTAAGRDMVEEVEPLYRERIHGLLAGLSQKECRAIIRSLERVRAGIGDGGE